MKIKKLLAAAFFCAAILCAMSVTGFAEGSDVVYVNTNYTNDTAVTRVDQAVGNDDNDGTEEYPVATIAKALELVNENGTIYVKGGLRSVAGLNTVVYKPVTIVGLEEDGNYVTFQYPLPTAAGTVTYKNFNFYKANIFTGSSGVDYSQLDLVVDGCDFISGGNAAMNVARPIKSITVQNCSFYTDGLTSYAKQYMVWAYDAKSIVIDNNTFDGGGFCRGAIHVGDGIETANSNRTVTIQNNTISNYERGIQVASKFGIVEQFTIAGNTFENIAPSSGTDNPSATIFIHENATADVVKPIDVTNNIYGSCETIVYAEGDTADAIDTFIGSFDGNKLADETVLTSDDLKEYTAYSNPILAKIDEEEYVRYATITDVIDAANDGDTITLAAGTYDLSEPDSSGVFGDVLYINKPITLKGEEGENDVEIKGSVRIQSDNVTVDGLKFTEPVVMPFGDPDPICIDINTGNYPNITITNCELAPNTPYVSGQAGSRHKGIVTSSSGTYNNLQITNNTFSNLETAISLNPASTDAVDGVSNVTISGNVADETNGAFAKLESVGTATITNNEISAMTYIRPDWSGNNPSVNVKINENAFFGFGIIVLDKAGQTADFDISANYWHDIPTPSPENCVYTAYQGDVGETVTPTMTSYYTTYNPNATEGEPMLSNLVQYITDPTQVAKEVVFEQVEGTNQFKVYLQGRATDEQGVATEDPATIINLVSVDFRINIEGDAIEEGGEDRYSFAFESFEVADPDWQFHFQDDNRFLIYQKGGENKQHDLSGEKIELGTLTIGGYGSGKIQAAAEPGNEDHAVEQRSEDGLNIVESSMLTGDPTPFTINAETANLDVTVKFYNEISDNPTDYQQMWAEISGGTLAEPIRIDFGGENNEKVKFDQTNCTYTFTEELIKDRTYTVAIMGEGYRTARYTVNMNDNKSLSFWNNVMDADTVIETGNNSSMATVTYLAGDIVKDNEINIYDLSAVVSYFGEVDLNVTGETYNKGYAKYDLNRDGKIDSKDVAMVLVSWGK